MDNSEKIILDLCGGTGSWSAPYRTAGYDVRLVTLPEYDVTKYVPPPGVYGVLAAPPCTHFSRAGARYWPVKDATGKTKEAEEILNACLNVIRLANPKFWALENPEGRMRNYLGKPALKFLQSDFGMPYKKPTCLWGEFNTMLIYGPIVENTVRWDSKRSHYPDLPDGYGKGIDHNRLAARRSMLPPAFAESFYLANR